ncbi:MFS transporter [Kitasatospora herbaricolor]|uniref:MFS transporter n=1 Tax=Kitasatospora herbaricolor TaxID=68217 RepID=UPI00174D8CF1|nr:MFS transporter [Kitasatospora herbaricolor]MDQ0307639.1 EmrB/QacA subfamily drug resistance transporter [Kitasatospora herbaricolor]GGV16134.1 MFS transporter [Kitasatospora herbaricolor]
MSVDAVAGEVPTRDTRSQAWGLLLVAIVGAEFMLQLDGTVVNVALPTLQSDLGLSVASGSWVPNAFLLAFGGLLLLAGRLGDVLGHRRVFVGGLGLVVLASLVAGLAPNIEVLLVGRLLQGAGAALAGPNGLALLAVVFEGERRQRAFGLYSTVTGLGASAGMVLGGVLTWAGDWRWSLLVNVPVGLLIIVVSLKTLGLAGTGARSRPLGLPSAALVTAAVTTAVYGLVHAAEKGWGDAGTLVPLAASVVLWVLLAVVDPRTSEPLLPAAIFASRERAGAFVNLLLLAAVLTSFLIYLVQYLQGVLHFNALQSGLAVLPFGLALLVSTQVLTKYVSGIGLKTRALLGLGVVLIGVAWLTLLDAHSSYATGVLPQIVLIGLGVGVAIIPFNMIILSTAPPEYAGVTAGVLQTALTVGGSLGLAVLLIPFTGGNGEIADTISTVFVWAAGATVLAILAAVLFWYGPGSGKPALPEQAAQV